MLLILELVEVFKPIIDPISLMIDIFSDRK